MDSYVSEWILDFILRQPLEMNSLSSLLQLLPLPKDSLRFKKSLLLCRIESLVSNGVVPEKLLTLLEHMEELKYPEASETLKLAYFTVAVDCTVKYLVKMQNPYISNPVKNIWRKVWEMEKFGKAGLLSDELMELKNEIKVAICKKNVVEELVNKLVKKRQEINPLDRVMDYINEEKQNLGKPFIDFVAESDNAQKVFGFEISEKNDQSSEPPLLSKDKNVVNSFPRRKSIANKRTTRLEYKGNTEAKICDVEEVKEGSSSMSKFDEVATPKIDNKVLESVEKRRPEFHVKKPLPSVILTKASKIRIERAAEVAAQEENGKNTTKRSFNEPNGTAHTLEWDDDSPETPNLPQKKRRPRKRWTGLEEDTLRTGVSKYGVGNWKIILLAYQSMFDDRTEVDLKDKWRNLTR